MKLRYGFGNGFQEVEVPEKNLIGELHANPVPPGLPEAEEVARALREPIGTPHLRDIVHPGEKIAVITSDVTRPMPTAKVMPQLLDELYAGGARSEDIPSSLPSGATAARAKRNTENSPESMLSARSAASTAIRTTAFPSA